MTTGMELLIKSGATIEDMIEDAKKEGANELRKTFNYCPRCGKPMPHEHNFVHTCTPPNWNRSGY